MRWVMRLWLLAALCGAVVGATSGVLYHRHVVIDPGPDLDRKHIVGVIAEESPVYFRDGVTRVGVFFSDEHRELVSWEELPTSWTAAIVAAEDSRFWKHPGFDVLGIARAMWSNVQAGAVVAGGSSLTQQTAKNLYYRPDRSARAKLVEALNALRLERHYRKEEILTFYANQFHVSGNGRGLGIAARYFFDKVPGQLGTVEAAFLAGLVKAPSAYDPFLGDEAKRAAARQRAKDRTIYVLRRLTEVDAEALAGPLPGNEPASRAAYEQRVQEVRGIQAEAAQALSNGFDLPFKKGTFRYDSSAVLDEVARRLAEPPFADVLSAAGIEDPTRAGLKVITTLDATAQRAATYGLWHHLTEVGVMLEGRTVADFIRTDTRAPQLDPGDVPVPWEFRLAQVVGPVEEGGHKELQVDLGGLGCRVDRDGLVRVAAAAHRGQKKNASVKVTGGEVDAFLAALPAQAVVWVSVRDVREGQAICDLELRPELQGAVVVLEDGAVRAMVGGNDNRNFNRASALRQFGSTWKTLVLHAAMELGWSPMDVLDNRRNGFPFSTTFYWPRPDHTPNERATLAWTGVTSENLATIWLLYHLVDRLDDVQLAELAAQVDLVQRPGETHEAFRTRVQQLGILSTAGRLPEAHFLQARREVLGSSAALAHPGDALAVASMLYGWGFDEERARSTDGSRIAALSRSYLGLSARRQTCGEAYRRLADAWSSGGPVPASAVTGLSVRAEGEWLEVACGAAPAGFGPIVDDGADEVVEGEGLPGELRRRQRPALRPEADLWIDGELHAGSLDALASAVERRRLERELAGKGSEDLYLPEVLHHHQDFRVLLAIRYVRQLAQQLGMQSAVKEVLSMPLGASEATLEEMTMVYGGMVLGEAWSFPGVASGSSGPVDVPPPAASTLLIEEIRDVDDRVIYRAVPKALPVGRPEVAAMTSDVLRNVIEAGTGRRAKGGIVIGGSAVPLGGKTGTTNDFRNAAFIGYVPEVTARAGLGDAPWLVGVYVGYDDNRPMSSGGIKLAGASGALPAWLVTARGLALTGQLGPFDARPPSGGWVLPPVEGLELASVLESGGLPGDGPYRVLRPVAAVPVAVAAPEVPVLDRPVRIAPRTSDAARMENAARRGGIWAAPRKKEGDEP